MYEYLTQSKEEIMGGCGRVGLCSCNIAVVCLLQFQKHLLMRKLGIYKKKIKLSSQVTCCFAYFLFMCGWSGVLICSAVSLCVNDGVS